MTTTKYLLDRIAPGSIVVLDFNGKFEEIAVFMGIRGTGDDRRALFMSKPESGNLYTWEAYRYSRRWAFGASAEHLRVLDVTGEIDL